jgi:hypothetical protein
MEARLKVKKERLSIDFQLKSVDVSKVEGHLVLLFCVESVDFQLRHDKLIRDLLLKCMS